MSSSAATDSAVSGQTECEDMPTLQIDPAVPQPPYEQLRRQLVEQIMSHRLPAETKLPPVRRLAANLGIAPNTVARAYRELETDGYLITQGRNGTRVAPIAPLTAQTQQAVRDQSSAYVTAMRELGLGSEAIIAAVRQAL